MAPRHGGHRKGRRPVAWPGRGGTHKLTGLAFVARASRVVAAVLVALLTYRCPGPLDVSFPADAGELAFVRRTLRGWLQRCGLEVDLLQNILIAAGEAIANAVEHGHRDDPGGRVRLQASASADSVTLIVRDTGSWKTPSPAADSDRGRGLILMRAFMDEVTVERGNAGTTVQMKARFS